MPLKQDISKINVRSRTYKKDTVEGACDCKQNKNASWGCCTSHPHSVRQIPLLVLSWKCLSQASTNPQPLQYWALEREYQLLLPHLLLLSGSLDQSGQLVLVSGSSSSTEISFYRALRAGWVWEFIFDKEKSHENMEISSFFQSVKLGAL